jgi:mannosyltransferase
MTTATPRRPLPDLLGVPTVAEVRAPGWLTRRPGWMTNGGWLVALLIISAVLRTRELSSQLWFAEADAVGLAQHPLGQLPGLLRAEGGAPLYYLLLHVWIALLGDSVSVVHALSLIISLLCVPLAMWVGWELGGRRAGWFAALLFAFSSYLTRYAQEAQPYALIVALALLTCGGLIAGFVRGRRRWQWLFALGLAGLLYTQATGLLLWVGAAAALGLVWATAPPARRAALRRDALLCFGGAFVAYLPWLPTTIAQIAHDTAPFHYSPLPGATVPSQLLGSERVDVTLLIAGLAGAVPFAARARRRSPEAMTLWALLVMAAVGLLTARVAGFIGAFWAWRYLGCLVAPLLLFGAVASARARVIGVAAMIFCVVFLANPASFAPGHKSDMQEVAAEMAPQLHPGDLVVVAQPEQAPLAWYYLPGGLRFANPVGPVADPSSVNWAGAMERLERAQPARTVPAAVATLKPGQQLLYVRPLTEGVQNWSGPWPQLVRRRAAQWGQALTADVASGILRVVSWAPHDYRSACCIADAAVLYQRAP